MEELKKKISFFRFRERKRTDFYFMFFVVFIAICVTSREGTDFSGDTRTLEEIVQDVGESKLYLSPEYATPLEDFPSNLVSLTIITVINSHNLYPYKNGHQE